MTVLIARRLRARVFRRHERVPPGLVFRSRGSAALDLDLLDLLAFRRGTPEERARLQPISIADLMLSAELGRWSGR